MKKLIMGLLLSPFVAFGQGTAIITIHNNSTGQIWADGWSQGGFDSFGGAGLLIAAGATANQFITWSSGPAGALYYHDCTDTTQFHTVQIADTSGVNFDVYISGTCDNYTGGGPPPSTNSEYCCTINNNSGQGQDYGLINVDTGQLMTIDACGENQQFVQAGASSTICISAAATNNLALVNLGGAEWGAQTSNLGQGGNPCLGNNSYNANPNPQGVISSTNLVGTPIPNGSSGAGLVNNNTGGTGFGNTGAQYTNASGTNGPISFNNTTGGLASNATLIAGFDANYAEELNVANAIGNLGVITGAGLGSVKTAVTGLGTSLTAIGASVSPLSGNLGTLNTSVNAQGNGINTTLGGMANSLTGLSNYDGQTASNTRSLGGLSNLLFIADSDLYEATNEIGEVVQNTLATVGALGIVSNYVVESFAYTNDALGGLQESWADGNNRNNLTNQAGGLDAGRHLAAITELGTEAAASSQGLSQGPFSAVSGSFWTLDLAMGSETYSYDLNPMDNAGIAEIASISRGCEQWICCVVFIFLVMKVFDKYLAGMTGTTQLQANRSSILGNSVGQLSGPIYLPVMVAMVAAVPLFIGVAITGSIGASWFGAVSAQPFVVAGHSEALQQSFWLADQFLPLNFILASFFWYLFIRLTAAPVWAFSMVILKTLVS